MATSTSTMFKSPMLLAVVAVVLYIISASVPMQYSLPFVLCFVGYCINLWNDNSTKTSSDKPSDAEVKLHKLEKDIESYRLERDHNLQKIAAQKSLVEENENLKRQLERQTGKTEQFLYKLGKLEKEDELHFQEKRSYEDQIWAEKKKYNDKSEEMNQVLFRYQQEKEQLILQLELERKEFNRQCTELHNQLQTAQSEKSNMYREACGQIKMLNDELEKVATNLRRSEEQMAIKDQQIAMKERQIAMKDREIQDKIKTNEEKVQEKQREIDQLKVLVEAQTTGETVAHCNICEERPKDTCIDPCGHTLCMVCATEITCRNNKCPVCRKRISKTLKIYFS